MDEINFCPVDCNFLNINERSQELNFVRTGLKLKHKCVKYKINLYHGNYHPNILKCSDCAIETLKKIQESKRKRVCNKHYQEYDKKRRKYGRI